MNKKFTCHAAFEALGEEAFRDDSLEGRPQLVCKCVMIVEGVHCGHTDTQYKGGKYYSADVIGKHSYVWDGKPVLLGHPESDGWSLQCANSKTVYDNQKVGVLFGTHFEPAFPAIGDRKATPARLCSEVWLDVQRMNALDVRLIQNIRQGKITEVSIGFIGYEEIGDGEWEGETYESKIVEIFPDHLAILLDEKGACSVKDGAGLLQLKSGDSPALAITKSNFKIPALTKPRPLLRKNLDAVPPMRKQ